MNMWEVRLVADKDTPASMRRRHGHVARFSAGGHPAIWPAVGTQGTLLGVPGVALDVDERGITWLMRAPWPKPADLGPPWARELSAKLDTVIRLLREAR